MLGEFDGCVTSPEGRPCICDLMPSNLFAACRVLHLPMLLDSGNVGKQRIAISRDLCELSEQVDPSRIDTCPAHIENKVVVFRHISPCEYDKLYSLVPASAEMTIKLGSLRTMP